MIKDFLPIYDKKELFVLPISDIDGRIIGTMQYPQASMQETITFYDKLKKPQELYQEIKQYFKKDTRMKSEEEIEAILMNTFNLVIDKMNETRHKRTQSAFHGAPKVNKGRETTRGVNIQEVCKKFNISLTDLLHNYTFEQYDWMCDQIVFYYNEQSEKTQPANNYVLNKSNVKDTKDLLAEHKRTKNNKVIKTEILSSNKF